MLRFVFKQSTYLSSGAIAVLLAFQPTPAEADPITLIGVVATAVGGAVSGSTAVAAFFGGSVLAAQLLGGALAFGLNYIGAQIFGQQSPDTQSSLRTRTEDTYPPFRFALGEFPQEGAMVFKYVDGEFLYYSLLLSSVPIDGGNLTVSMNDTLLDLTGDIFDMELGGGAYPSVNRPYSHDGPGSTDRASGNAEIVTMWMGRGTQTKFPQDWIDYLADDLPDISSASWNSAAVLHVRCRYGADSWARARWSGPIPPKVEVKCKWAKLYDPRLDSTSGVTGASGLQRWDTPTTWAYSANPALAYLTILMHEKGLAVPQERVIIQMFADAADACDVATETRAKETVWSSDFSVDPGIINRTSAAIDPGSGVLAYSRGTIQVSGGVLEEISTDTGGTIEDGETCRYGIYFDVAALGLNPSKTYEFDAIATVVRPTPYIERQVITQAENTADLSATEQVDYSLPAAAGSESVIFDSGFLFNGDAGTGPVNVKGRFIGWTRYSGRPNGAAITSDDMSFTFEEAASTEAKFECHGIVPIQSREYDTLQGVLDSMAGYLDTTGGGIGVKAGVWTAPTVSLSEPLAESFNYTGRSDPGADIFIGVFLGRESDYGKTETLPYVLDATGGRRQSIPLSMVSSADQAQRIVKIMALRARYNRIMQGVWGPEEFARRTAEPVDFVWPLLQGKADGDWICAEERVVMEDADDGFRVHRQLAFRETDSIIYDWDPDVDFPGGATSIIAPPPIYTVTGDPQNLTVVSGNAAAQPTTSTATAAADYQTAVRVRWEPSTGTVDEYEVQISVAGGSHQPHAVIDSELTVFQGETVYLQSFVNPAIAGVVYAFRVRALGPGGESDWVTGSVTAAAPSGTVRDYSTDYSLDYG